MCCADRHALKCSFCPEKVKKEKRAASQEGGAQGGGGSGTPCRNAPQSFRKERIRSVVRMVSTASREKEWGGRGSK